MASLVLVALVVVVLMAAIALVQRAKRPWKPVPPGAPPRSSSSRLGALLIGCSALVAIAGCRLDILFLPQRWSLSDEPLPPWFFGALGQAWNYGLPLAVLVLLGAGLVLVWRGGAA